MAPLSDYVTGTITLTNGSAAFTGSGTGWLAAAFREGDTILGIEDNPGVTYVIESITDNDAGTLTQPWDGPTGTYEYRMRYLADGQRVTAQARTLIELLGNGNIQALAGLSGTPNTLAMFTGAGAMVEVPRTDLVSGANYDVQVDTLPDRDAYDGQDAGFTVLVNDTGDGRAAIYSKLSNASADWSGPAYVTGPIGPEPDISIGTVTRGDADVTSTPVTGGYELDFTIPSQVAQGDYGGATAYVTGDVVQYQGSSWVALQATTGIAPPTLPTTSNTYWQLLARAGNDGAGTVTSLSGGTGISIDSTDPTVPIVSAVIASQAEAEAGTVADKLMTPERTAQAIAELGGVDQLFTDDLTGEFDANEKARARANIGLSKWSMRAIGEIVYVDTSLIGVETPPTDAGFIELSAGLDGSGQYNEDKLTGETITGSGATLIATAVIDDTDSPMNGETIHLLNTEERVRYAGERTKAGDVFNDQMQQITGQIELNRTNFLDDTGAFSDSDNSGGNTSASGGSGGNAVVKFDSANSPDARVGDRTRAKGQFAVAFLKYKDVV